MQDFGAIETVKFRRRSGTVCSYIFREKAVADFKIARQLFRNRNLVETIAGGADNGTYLFFALPKCAEIWNPVVIHHAGKRVINTVVYVVEDFAVSSGFADYFRDQHG